MTERWQNQEEAFQFALQHSAVMLDMDMGTGKTRTTLDVAYARPDVHAILVVCPKAVIPVWRHNLEKFEYKNWQIWDRKKGTIKQKTVDLQEWIKNAHEDKCFIVINYDSVWRTEMGDFLYKKINLDMIILDESHRAKAAGSKVSKYLAMIGKKVKYRMCLSGTPMANSPLDIYGQYRFLDPTIFGTRYNLFEQEFAIMGGPDLKFVVGYKNQQELNRRFRSIAYTCKMSDIADKIKLPPSLPDICRYVEISSKDRKVINDLSRDFIAECNNSHIVVNNVLVKMLRIQQICSGFCLLRDDVFDAGAVQELNTSKEDELNDIMMDMDPHDNIVVFCVFRHDLEAVRRVTYSNNRQYFELSGDENTLEDWKKTDGAVIGVQIQAGAEGVDMTKANHAIYYSLPHSLMLYNQSRARLYRPGQERPVSFIHLLVADTIDEKIYNSLARKQDVIDAIKSGTF